MIDKKNNENSCCDCYLDRGCDSFPYCNGNFLSYEKINEEKEKVNLYIEKSLQYDVQILGREHSFYDVHTMGEIENAYDLLREHEIL